MVAVAVPTGCRRLIPPSCVLSLFSQRHRFETTASLSHKTIANPPRNDFGMHTELVERIRQILQKPDLRLPWCVHRNIPFATDLAEPVCVRQIVTRLNDVADVCDTTRAQGDAVSLHI